ncbi:YrrS family protein [Ornithinibacillus xuwenensis]|uniref:YrrS family protein n=1 Tax=Ornithinibacillus xuwenensis TaxID=3144668 RepID=A0ABU9XCB5_9BACI
MSEFDRHTRVNKFEKRRKNTKLMSILISAAIFLIVLLIGMWIFGPDDEPANTDETTSDEKTNDTADDEAEDTETDENTEQDSEASNDEDSSQTEESSSDTEESDSTEDEGTTNDNVDKEPTEPNSDDDNVIEAYTGAWQPVGTEQTGPHTTQFVTESQDWKEMEKAIRLATGLSEEEMETYWIGNGGDQKAIGTVTNKAETEIYRVYISWVDGQGWQPTLVEVLKELEKNDN